MKDTLPSAPIPNVNIEDTASSGTTLNEDKQKVQDLKEKLNKQIQEIKIKKNQNKNLE
jgi:hypothetical protein